MDTKNFKKESLLLVLLVTVSLHAEVHSQECVNGLISAERVHQLGRVAGNIKSDLSEQQRIIPDIKFTCSGMITEWIFAAEWHGGEDSQPQLQIWRPTAEDGVYTKLHETVFGISDESSTKVYQYTIMGVEVQSGDVLGLFQPEESRLEFYYNEKYGPVNHYDSTENATPLGGDFSISSDADGTENDMLLVTVEITPTDGSLASDCIRNFATMEAIEIGLQQSGKDKPLKEEEKEQRLIPGINFTCHGFITKWIIAAKWDNGGDRENFPELQTWNSSDGTTYIKPGATTFSVSGGSKEMTYYEYSPNPPHEFSDGDVLGMFIPDKALFRLFFERVDSAPVNYVTDTGSDILAQEDYSTTGQDTINAVPLVAVEVTIPSQAVTSSPVVSIVTSATEPLSTSPTPTVTATTQEGRSSGIDSGVSTTEDPRSTTTSVNTPVTPVTLPESPPATPQATLPVTVDESSSSSDPSGMIAVVVVVLVVLILMVSIAGAVVGLLIVQRKKKRYNVQEHVEMSELKGMVNPVYDGNELQSLEATELKTVRDLTNPIYATADQPMYEDVEALPYEDFVVSTMMTDHDRILQSCYVPTEDQRREYEDTEAVYAALAPVIGSRDEAEVYFQESEIYWAPASTENDLYAQLAKNKFREIPRPHIIVTDMLGAGQFGQVSRGIWQSSGGSTDVAVKMLRPSANEEEKVKFLQEAAIMGQFHHPNVVTLHGVVTVVEPAMIVLELMKFGDLRSYLQNMRPIPGELVPSTTAQTCLGFGCQIASGMDYLSKKAFVHRDLAARNILVSEQKMCKIADFGMSRDLGDGDYYVSQGGKIPVKWTAPEAVNFKKYSSASDVWSYGAVMYEIWSLGHKPFEGYTNMEVIPMVNEGRRLPPPSGCPKEVYQLMIDCWHPEAGSRPSFSDLLQSLSRPETELLSWTEEDTKTHPQAAVLGGPLDAGKDLYPDLQGTYTHD